MIVLAAHRPLFAIIGRCRDAGIFRQGRTATSVAATDFITYNFTEITITTPLLTRILDRLIGGGIILCGARDIEAPPSVS